MDLRTILLMLAVGSFLFGLLLIILRFKKNNPQKVPFWIAAKMLQALGSFMLFYRTSTYNVLTVAANASLLLGCAYEAWAIRLLSGQTVERRYHIFTSIGIVFICFAAVFLAEPYGIGLVFLFQSAFYILPFLFLINKLEKRFSLQLFLALSYFIAGLVFLINSVLCLVFPEYALKLEDNAMFSIIPIVSFCIFLISGFILLMVFKERNEIRLLEIQDALRKTESRFQKIVETAIEGILIFDENYNITFANKNMASMLGYTVEEVIGMPYSSFFPKSQIDIYKQQEALRKKGEDSIYECCLLTKDGQERWFLVSARAIVDDFGRFEGSFGMLTDINERKEMELLLEESNRKLKELSNKDSLTGIANRRCFDDTLEREYFRLNRTNSKLSIILLDLDPFKQYNDCYGHVMGDECLRKIGKALASCVSRSVDLVARYGGEEFACILPDTDIQGAVKIAEEIRQTIQDLKIEHKGSAVSEFVTASFGVITVRYSPEISPVDAVAMADKLLYKAKVSGRNRVEYAEFEKICKS